MLKVFTTFSGYDSQCIALDRIKHNYPFFDYDLVGWSEIEKSAIIAHDALFPQWKDRNFGDVCKIDWKNVDDFDLLTYSSPCQDFSKTGKWKGGKKGSNTKSSLLWMIEDAVIEKIPKYLVFENVANIVSKTFINTFNEWQLTLEKLGYRNYAKILNAVDFGVPQSRNRIYLISIRNDINGSYYFPQPSGELTSVYDVLDDDVDDRYFLSTEYKQKLFDRSDVDDYVLRRLTPVELFRLMGLNDSEIERMMMAKLPYYKVNRLSGNSIVVNVLEQIFIKLLINRKAMDYEQLNLF